MTISMAYSIVAAASYAFIGLFGSLSNSLVTITYLKWRTKLLTQPKDVLILSLSVGDLVLASVVCPLGFASVVSQRWTSGYAGCVFYGFLSTWIGLSTIAQLSLLAVERLMTLSSPTPNIITVKRAFQMVTVAWALSFISSCFPLIGKKSYVIFTKLIQ